jgi:hypothetical protein
MSLSSVLKRWQAGSNVCCVLFPLRVYIPSTRFMQGAELTCYRIIQCSAWHLPTLTVCEVLQLISMVPLGQGQVTVVLDAGLGMSSLSWNWIGT